MELKIRKILKMYYKNILNMPNIPYISSRLQYREVSENYYNTGHTKNIFLNPSFPMEKIRMFR